MVRYGSTRSICTASRRGAGGQGGAHDAVDRREHGGVVVAGHRGAERAELRREPGRLGGVDRGLHVRTWLAVHERLHGELDRQRHEVRIEGASAASPHLAGRTCPSATGVTGYVGAMRPQRCPRHRRVRLHRRSAGARAARRRLRGALPGANAGQARRRRLARPGRGRAGRRHRRRGPPRARWPASTPRTTSCTRWAARPTFEQHDRQAAGTFRDAAADAGSARIVYLGGLGRDDDPNLSRHLAEPPRGRPCPRRRAGAGDRAAGRGHHRLGQRELRDAALAGRGPPGHGRPRGGWRTGASRSRSATS